MSWKMFNMLDAIVFPLRGTGLFVRLAVYFLPARSSVPDRGACSVYNGTATIQLETE
jgi:hypothetical protein